MIKHIYFLRHFPTENNLTHVLNGRSLTTPIVNSTPIHCEDSINDIFCSSALRCRQTIECFSQSTLSSITYTDLLLERDLGIFEGQPRNQMQTQYPTLFFNSKLIVFATTPKGETFSIFQNRIRTFWNICNNTSHGSVLICSHNQTLKMLYFEIKKSPLTIDTWNNLSFPHGKIIKIQ